MKITNSNKDFTHGGNVHKAAIELGISKDKILDFSANINPLGLSPKGRKAIIKNLNNILNYPDPDSTELIDNIANYYGVDHNCILPGNGAIELIYQYTRIKESGKALIPAPGFIEYEKALLTNSWNIDFYNKKDIDLSGINVVFICNPNNPTGFSYSEKFLFNLLKQCKENSIDLFIDEAFIEYSTSISMVKYLKDYDNLYILKSLTKFYAIPGLRIGMLLTSNRSFNLLYQKNYIPWTINSVVQDYVKHALTDKRYINKSLKYIKHERVWLFKELSKISTLKTFRTQGNYIMFRDNSGLDLVERLRLDGILIRSCANYNNLDNTYYRVAVKRRNENKKLLKSLVFRIKNGLN